MRVCHSRCYARAGLFLSFVVLLTVPGQVFADDAPAPSLGLETDAGAPIPRVAMTIDVSALVLEAYGAQVEVAPWPVFSVRVAPFWRRSGGRSVGLDLALRVRPWADGVAGPFAGLVTVVMTEDGGRRRGALGGEVGWSGVYGRLLVGFSLGALRWLEPRAERDGLPIAPRVVLAFGTAM